MTLELLKANDKRLKVKARTITDFSYVYSEIIEEIMKICLRNKAYAAAATQFGINERFIVIMTTKEITDINKASDEYNVSPYFNPIIKEMYGEQYYYEACMSVLNAAGLVRRPYGIKIDYQDMSGIKHSKTIEGFESIIFCHEIDHLNGIEYTDRAKILYLDVIADERMTIRKKYPHRVTRKDGTFRYKKSKQIIKKYPENV